MSTGGTYFELIIKYSAKRDLLLMMKKIGNGIKISSLPALAGTSGDPRTVYPDCSNDTFLLFFEENPSSLSISCVIQKYARLLNDTVHKQNTSGLLVGGQHQQGQVLQIAYNKTIILKFIQNIWFFKYSFKVYH
jgi:hypothetical protein